MSGIRKDAFIHILRGNTKRLLTNEYQALILYYSHLVTAFLYKYPDSVSYTIS